MQSIEQKKISRRAFMALAGGAVVNIGLPGRFQKVTAAENSELATQLRPDGRPRLPPGQHAVKQLAFMGGIKGPGNVPGWRLALYGEALKPGKLSFKELMQFEQVQLTCDVHCVTGWSLLDANWIGVSLNTLMQHVGITPKAGFVIFEAPGGYTANIPVAEARKDNVILAHSFEGEPLTLPHGQPLRALVPDLYFWKSAKWLEKIYFSSKDIPGYYETSGYSNSADPWKEERFAPNAGSGH